MITITTRKLDATDTECDRIKATASTGETATIPYPYREGLDGVAAHMKAVRSLSAVGDVARLTRTGETARGYTFHVGDYV
jgi:hypothetical protein